jgi:hypothetical protein
LRRGVSFGYLFSLSHDGFADQVLPTHFQRLRYSVERFKRITFYGRIAFGTGINYDPVDPMVGNSLAITQSVTLRPSSRLNSEFLFLRSTLVDRRTGAKFFNQDILRNRTSYQFTESQALRSIIDYDTAARRIGLSMLYAYTPRPNTSLYLGYSSLLFNGLDPIEDRRTPGLFRQSSTLFIKTSYSFRF